jgi:branched-chain amino acid transport system permease protein
MEPAAPDLDLARRFLARRSAWRPLEALPWVLALAAIPVFADSLFVGTQVLILVLFAVSLDMILGYAGILTLGHAAFFGLGAYAAGGLAVHARWLEPLSGLMAAGVFAAAAGAAAGYVLLRYQGLPLLMLTLAVGVMLGETANAWDSFTGGFDGLSGISVAPLLGVFSNDLYGRNYYVYTLAVLAAVFIVCRRVVHSPFGLSLAGVRENPARMPAIGCDLLARRVAVYALSAFIAGLAGGLFAQSNGFITLHVFSFLRSGTVLIVLVLGGTGRLYGAFLGGAVYHLLEHKLAKISPEFWEFGVGLTLLAVVSFGGNGLLGIGDALLRRLRRAR